MTSPTCRVVTSSDAYVGRQGFTYLAGDYVYIPADLPHLVMNRSGATCRALVAHTAADDQAGIVLLPDLDALV